MTKTDTTIQKAIKKYSSEAGLTIMALATVIGLIDISEHSLRQSYVPVQPVKYASFSQSTQGSNPLRREKEENSTEYVSYSEAERTPSRSGRY